MKIFIFAPGADHGGVATALMGLINLLESHGDIIKVMVPYKTDIANAAIPKKYIVGYCRKRPIRFRVVQRMVNLFSLLTEYRFYFCGVKKIPHDICIVYSAPNNAHWVRYTNKPIIGWFHGVAALRRDEACISWQETRRTELMEKFYGRFYRLVAITDEVADSYLKRYKIARPEVIANQLNIDEIVAQSNALEGVKHLLFVGRVSHEKGLDRLIRALGKLKRGGTIGWHLTVVGDGPERSLNEVLVDKLGLKAEVSFVGMVRTPYLFMRYADLLICPSRLEGLGLVIWEALICSTPVLATDSGGPRTALRAGEWGCLVANTDEALLSGLRDYLDGKVDCLPSCGFDTVVRELRTMNGEMCKKVYKLTNLTGGG